MKEKKPSKLENILHQLYWILPLVAFAYGINHYYMKNRVQKTVEDVVQITKSVAADYLAVGKNYRDFNTDIVVLSNYVPFGLDPKQKDGRYILPNRFGGRMYVEEAVATQRERTLYFSLFQQQERYHQLYSGVGAYTIYLTHMSNQACKALATTDWAQLVPNFMGLEVAYNTKEDNDNGIYNLNYLLTDNSEEKIPQTLDSGLIARRPLTKEEAQTACGCGYIRNACSVALKFR